MHCASEGMELIFYRCYNEHGVKEGLRRFAIFYFNVYCKKERGQGIVCHDEWD